MTIPSFVTAATTSVGTTAPGSTTKVTTSTPGATTTTAGTTKGEGPTAATTSAVTVTTRKYKYMKRKVASGWILHSKYMCYHT